MRVNWEGIHTGLPATSVPLHLHHLISIFPPTSGPWNVLRFHLPPKPPRLLQAPLNCLSVELKHPHDQSHTVRHTI